MEIKHLVNLVHVRSKLLGLMCIGNCKVAFAALLTGFENQLRILQAEAKWASIILI